MPQEKYTEKIIPFKSKVYSSSVPQLRMLPSLVGKYNFILLYFNFVLWNKVVSIFHEFIEDLKNQT